jgi:hypothetical protein
MVNLADLSKLLNQGHLSEEYILDTSDGTFKFKMKTLTPLEELEVDMIIDEVLKSKNIAIDDQKYRPTYGSIELLSRAITEVNSVPFEAVPGAMGEDALQKRRSLVTKFSLELLLKLWIFYNEMKNKISLKGTKEESEEIKK